MFETRIWTVKNEIRGLINAWIYGIFKRIARKINLRRTQKITVIFTQITVGSWNNFWLNFRANDALIITKKS